MHSLHCSLRQTNQTWSGPEPILRFPCRMQEIHRGRTKTLQVAKDQIVEVGPSAAANQKVRARVPIPQIDYTREKAHNRLQDELAGHYRRWPPK